MNTEEKRTSTGIPVLPAQVWHAAGHPWHPPRAWYRQGRPWSAAVTPFPKKVRKTRVTTLKDTVTVCMCESLWMIFGALNSRTSGVLSRGNEGLASLGRPRYAARPVRSAQRRKRHARPTGRRSTARRTSHELTCGVSDEHERRHRPMRHHHTAHAYTSARSGSFWVRLRRGWAGQTQISCDC